MQNETTADPDVADGSFRAEARRLRHLLAQAGDERQRYYDALIAIQTSYLVNHTSKWVKATVDEALKNA